MGYLIPSDLKRQIQNDNLQQIIGGDTSILTAVQLVAQEEAATYLVQKYDLSSEFTDTTAWNFNSVYKAANRVYLDAAAYSSSATYALNAVVLQAGNIYKCTTAITVAEAFTISKWSLLGAQYDIFYAVFPQPKFQLLNSYAKGNQVFWNDKVYTAIANTRQFDHDSILQFEEVGNVPYQNFFPDDPVNGPKQWSAGVPYTVPANTNITSTTYWVKGDNRSQNLMMYVVDIALYHLHSRIAPRNIPELRVKRYDDAIANLKNYAKGFTTANLPKIQPPQGRRIRWGSQIKNRNSY